MSRMCIVLLSSFCLVTQAVDIGYHRVVLNRSNNLYLDGTDSQVTGKKNTDLFIQSWNSETTDFGTFYFINKKTNETLAVKDGVKKGNSLITTEERIYKDSSQQWYINSDGTIVNASDKELAIEIQDDGTVVVNTLDREDPNQQLQIAPYTILN